MGAWQPFWFVQGGHGTWWSQQDWGRAPGPGCSAESMKVHHWPATHTWWAVGSKRGVRGWGVPWCSWLWRSWDHSKGTSGGGPGNSQRDWLWFRFWWPWGGASVSQGDDRSMSDAWREQSACLYRCTWFHRGHMPIPRPPAGDVQRGCKTNYNWHVL